MVAGNSLDTVEEDTVSVEGASAVLVDIVEVVDNYSLDMAGKAVDMVDTAGMGIREAAAEVVSVAGRVFQEGS